MTAQVGYTYIVGKMFLKFEFTAVRRFCFEQRRIVIIYYTYRGKHTLFEYNVHRMHYVNPCRVRSKVNITMNTN